MQSRKSTAIDNMTIGLDLTWMKLPNEMGGGFQYGERLLTSLVRYTDHSFVVFMTKGQEKIFDHLSETSNLRILTPENDTDFYRAIRKLKVRLMHTPVQPYRFHTRTIPLVATVHDVQHLYFPEFFSEKELKWRDYYYKRTISASERIIVSFKHVKEDISRFFNVPLHRIDVCQIGIDVPVQVDLLKSTLIKNKYGLSDEYLFYSANTWQHKNHVSLIRALKILHTRYDKKMTLVCTGLQYEEEFKTIKDVIMENGLDNYVIFTGYIPEEEKLILLNNAALVVIPTLYEAGSFPLMEAMNFGIPVICSNVTALPDQIGDERFIFDPNDLNAIAEKINRMMTDRMLRHENIENSLKKSSETRWEKTIEQFIHSYNSAVHSFKEDKKLLVYFRSKEYFHKEFNPRLRGQVIRLLPDSAKKILKKLIYRK